jgi:DNA-binding transcriptional ArsR family regulator
VRKLLLPLFPRASYFPDFLTPLEGVAGLEAGLDAILATPPGRVALEVDALARKTQSPAWIRRLTEKEVRGELVAVLRAYHRVVIAPHEKTVHEGLHTERVRLAHHSLHAGTEGLLEGLPGTVRWRHPYLEINAYPQTHDIRLGGRGLLLIPTYFCWSTPVALADPALPPVLTYPVHRASAATAGSTGAGPGSPPLQALLGRARSAVLQAAATGVTTTEAARQAGVTPATATHHTTALRDAGLITSHRQGNTVLHTLTLLGAALLNKSPREPAV